METKISKAEAKRPDIVTAQLKKGFVWTTEHSKAALGLGAGLAVIALAWSAWSWNNNRVETAAQEKYFASEKEYLQKKNKLEEGKESKATGDMEQDYGADLQSFKNLVQQQPSTKAAKLAALTATEIYGKYKKYKEAIDLMMLTKPEGDKSTLASLMTLQIGNMYAEANDCQQATIWWGKLTSPGKQSSFLTADTHLRMALCYEQLKQSQMAEDNYNKILAEAKGTELAKTAERYLLLLKAKPN